jgi:hypothetical protein
MFDLATPLVNFRMMNRDYSRRDICILSIMFIVGLVVIGGICLTIYYVNQPETKLIHLTLSNAGVAIIVLICVSIVIICFLVGYLWCWYRSINWEKYPTSPYVEEMNI